MRIATSVRLAGVADSGIVSCGDFGDQGIPHVALRVRFCGVAAHVAKRDKPLKLSRQQKLVLELSARGLRRAEIVEAVGLTQPTVKTRLSHVYRKLGVHNAMDAVLKAREPGLID